MRIRLLLATALVGSLVGIASPAQATCHPEKPSTCEPCRITGIEWVNGRPQIATDC